MPIFNFHAGYLNVLYQREYIDLALRFPQVPALTQQQTEALDLLDAIEAINKRKAAKLYDFIDASDFYSNPVEKSVRSRMNVPFLLADDNLNADFLAQAEAADLTTLKGHRSVGGMRASIYNAMPESGIDALIDFMQTFEKKNG